MHQFYFYTTLGDQWTWKTISADGATVDAQIVFASFLQCLAHARRHGYVSGAKYVLPDANRPQ
jgi:hypothetical protein